MIVALLALAGCGTSSYAGPALLHVAATDPDGGWFELDRAIVFLYLNEAVSGQECTPGNWATLGTDWSSGLGFDVGFGAPGDSSVALDPAFSSITWVEGSEAERNNWPQLYGGRIDVIESGPTRVEFVIGGGQVCRRGQPEGVAACIPQTQDASILFEADVLPLMAPSSDGFPGYGVAVDSQEALCGLTVSPPIPE